MASEKISYLTVVVSDMMFGHFYDNCAGNKQQHELCPYITFHKVHDNPTFEHGDEHALQDLMAHEPPLVQAVAHAYAKHFPHSFYDPQSGTYLDDGTDFFQHVVANARSKHVSAFVFDWDRTLQQFECMSTRSFDSWRREFPTVTEYDLAKALAVFHAGGTRRFHKLRRMFHEIQRHGQHVYILTGNPAVCSHGRSVYLKIIQHWGLPHFRLGHATHKYEAMSNDATLNALCGPKLTF